MRRTDQLITQSRADTDNRDFDTDRGISNEQFLEWMNNAQRKIQSIIIGKHPTTFEVVKTVQSVAQQEAYDKPDEMYQGTSIKLVEFSTDGQEQNYNALDKRYLRERVGGVYGTPFAYIPRGNQILLQNIPSTSNGFLRWTYYRRAPWLELRRGQVTAVVLSATGITSLTVDPTSLNDDDIAWITNWGFVTVCGSDGTQNMKKIPVTAIDSTTGAVTVSGSFAFQTGETINVGDYLVPGPNSTFVSILDDNCEQYLLYAMNARAFGKDSSNDVADAKDWMKDFESQLKESYAESEEDIDGIPVADTDYLDCN